jgi:uncharacterized protein YjiS (DUF1127 family)
MVHAQSNQLTQLQDLAMGHALPPMSALALRVAVTLAKWDRNAKTRHHLKELPDYLLDDIGLSREAASKEARRTFWQG